MQKHEWLHRARAAVMRFADHCNESVLFGIMVRRPVSPEKKYRDVSTVIATAGDGISPRGTGTELIRCTMLTVAGSAATIPAA